ncbi:hypothetical protein [Azospirillum himalayense]|uniref:4-oxalocrotonate tautomerase domain-containing protein n=1 Tax=Azospirillum himalayense TaxID=654847 RepID=A0ABW0GBT3_9PROT
MDYELQCMILCPPDQVSDRSAYGEILQEVAELIQRRLDDRGAYYFIEVRDVRKGEKVFRTAGSPKTP